MPSLGRRPYGVGFSYRPEIQSSIIRHQREIDLLEIANVDYVIRHRRLDLDLGERNLREALERFPAVGHGITMSIGSVEPHDDPLLDETLRFLDRWGVEEYSEHLTYHRLDGVDTSIFFCLPFEASTLRWVAARYQQVRRRLRGPMGLENVSYNFPVPGCAYDEAAFLTRLTQLTDCWLLLDVTNVYNNAVNHGYDPVEFIRKLPGDRVKQLHLAGGHQEDGRWVDSHSHPVMPPVWDLLHEVLRLTRAEAVVLERDDDLEPFERKILPDLRKAREIFYQHRPARAEEYPQAPAQPMPPTPTCDALLADAEIAQLRDFQRATMAVMIRPEVHRLWKQNPRAVAEQFLLRGDWAERWLGCDRGMLDLCHKTTQDVLRGGEEARRASQQREWANWFAR
jgi:uncharacterized protein (UPF0276 family)